MRTGKKGLLVALLILCTLGGPYASMGLGDEGWISYPRLGRDADYFRIRLGSDAAQWEERKPALFREYATEYFWLELRGYEHDPFFVGVFFDHELLRDEWGENSVLYQGYLNVARGTIRLWTETLFLGSEGQRGGFDAGVWVLKALNELMVKPEQFEPSEGFKAPCLTAAGNELWVICSQPGIIVVFVKAP